MDITQEQIDELTAKHSAVTVALQAVKDTDAAADAQRQVVAQDTAAQDSAQTALDDARNILTSSRAVLVTKEAEVSAAGADASEKNAAFASFLQTLFSPPPP